MRYALPLALTAVALTVTYFTCLRPLRRGRAYQDGIGSPDVDPQLRQLREEVQLLRHEAEVRRQAPLVHDADPPQRRTSIGGRTDTAP